MPLTGRWLCPTGGAPKTAAPSPLRFPSVRDFLRSGKLLTLMLGHLTVDSYVGVIPVLYPILIGRFHLSLATVGLVSLAYGGMAAVSQPLFGVLADRIWSENSSSDRKAPTFEATDLGMRLYSEVVKLSPKTDAQRFLQAKASDAITDVGKTRLLLFTSAGRSIPIPFLIVLIGWLTLIFASISLFAESNARAIAVLCIFSFSATAAIFLILELSQPFAGIMMISDQPLRDALPALNP